MKISRKKMNLSEDVMSRQEQALIERAIQMSLREKKKRRESHKVQ